MQLQQAQIHGVRTQHTGATHFAGLIFVHHVGYVHRYSVDAICRPVPPVMQGTYTDTGYHCSLDALQPCLRCLLE